MSSTPAAATSVTTPIPISPRTRIILLFALVIAAVLLLRAVPGVVQTFFGAMTLALLLSFPVRLLARYMRRGLAILVTILALNIVIILALVVIVPLLVKQLGALIDALPQYMADLQSSFHSLLQPLRDRGILPTQPGELTDSLEDGFAARGQAFLGDVLAGMLGFFANALGGLVHFFIMMLMSIYLVADIARVKAAAVRLAPARYRTDADQLWTRLGVSVSRYLGGLVFSMTEQGTLVLLGSWLLGIPYAVLLGVWFGLTAVIPYLGAWLGAIPLVLIALFSGGIVKALLALGLTFLVNGFDSNIVQPRIQGKALEVHPVVIMLTVLAGSELAGPLGAVFALPIMGMAKVVLDFFLDRLEVHAPPPPVVITVPGRVGETTAADEEAWTAPAGVAVSAE